MPRRSHMISPWGFCQRCGVKTHLAEMKRQNGILICLRGTCNDTAQVGDFDIKLAKKLEELSDSPEMQPHGLLLGDPVEEDIFDFNL